LERENTELKKVNDAQRALILSLEARVKTLEGGAKPAQAAVAKPSAPAPAKPAAKDEDDGVDLFGNNAKDEEVQKIKQERVAAYAAEKSKSIPNTNNKPLPYEQLVDHRDGETGADADGHVTTEHLPGEGRIEVNVTLLSDVAEDTEMLYPAVDSADREEHNSFDHSIGTDSGLTEAAGNYFSEGLVSRRYSVAEKIALMVNLMSTRPKSPTSLATENAVSSSHMTLTVILNESLTNCKIITSTGPETIVDTTHV
jgi:hypothetical protein